MTIGVGYRFLSRNNNTDDLWTLDVEIHRLWKSTEVITVAIRERSSYSVTKRYHDNIFVTPAVRQMKIQKFILEKNMENKLFRTESKVVF